MLLPKVGDRFQTVRDFILVRNQNVKILSSASNQSLPKGTLVEITAVGSDFFEVNCRDGVGTGASAWGLKLQVKKAAWGISFERVP